MNVIRSTQNHRRLAALAVATAALSLSAFASTAFAAGTNVTGSSTFAGVKFFDTAVTFPGSGKHGDLIRYREAASSNGNYAADASKSYQVLYRSTKLNGQATAVSGTVWIPKGTAPVGGWPVISWAHGTTGAADVCAPSRFQDYTIPTSGDLLPAVQKAKDARAYNDATLGDWLRAGYAVVATDYEGLGTPGPHPYLLGHSEGRGVIDIVAAAHQLPAVQLSNKWVASGHSQGGHAALYAAADAAAWTATSAYTGSVLKGVAAFAPANTLGNTVLFAKGFIHGASSISGLGALIVRSITMGDGSVKISDLMPTGPAALIGHLETGCDNGSPDLFGQYAPSALLKTWPSSVTSALQQPKTSVTYKAFSVLSGDVMSPNSLHITVPVLITTGRNDSTAFCLSDAHLVCMAKDNLAPALRTNGATVTVKDYVGVSHTGVVVTGDPTAGFALSTAWSYTKSWIPTQLAK